MGQLGQTRLDLAVVVPTNWDTSAVPAGRKGAARGPSSLRRARLTTSNSLLVSHSNGSSCCRQTMACVAYPALAQIFTHRACGLGSARGREVRMAITQERRKQRKRRFEGN